MQVPLTADHSQTKKSKLLSDPSVTELSDGQNSKRPRQQLPAPSQPGRLHIIELQSTGFGGWYGKCRGGPAGRVVQTRCINTDTLVTDPVHSTGRPAYSQKSSQAKSADRSDSARQAAATRKSGSRSASLADQTKEQLMKKARAQNIRGRSTMRKQELISALRRNN